MLLFMLMLSSHMTMSASVDVSGVAVSSVLFGTTLLMYLVMLMIWETNFFLATAFLLFFGFIDMVYTTGEFQPFVTSTVYIGHAARDHAMIEKMQGVLSCCVFMIGLLPTK